MKDYRTTLERLRREAAEAALIGDLATDLTKRETFAKLAARLAGLADQVEQALNNAGSGPTAASAPLAEATLARRLSGQN